MYKYCTIVIFLSFFITAQTFAGSIYGNKIDLNLNKSTMENIEGGSFSPIITWSSLSSQQQIELQKKMFAKAENGTGGRGGGNIVVLKNGEIHLLDLISDIEKDSAILPNPSSLGLRKECGINSLHEFHASHGLQNELNKVVGRLSYISPNFSIFLQVHINLILSKIWLIDFIPAVDLTPWRDGTRVDPSLQLPVAYYGAGIIYILKPVFEKLSAREQAALVLHEALRQVRASAVNQTTLIDTQSAHDSMAAIEQSVFQLFSSNPDRDKLNELLLLPELANLSQTLSTLSSAGHTILADYRARIPAVGLIYEEKDPSKIPSWSDEQRSAAHKKFISELSVLLQSLKSDARLWYLLKNSTFSNFGTNSLVFRAVFVINARGDGTSQELSELQELMEIFNAANLDLEALSNSRSSTQQFLHSQEADCSTIHLLVN